MIKLDLLMFGGRGGAGGNGNGSGGTGGSSGRSRGSAGSSGIGRGGYSTATERQKSLSAGRITSVSSISSKENYTMFRIVDNKNKEEREVFYKDKTGRELRDNIADEKIDYDRKQKAWVTKKGYRYAIRKK